MISRTGHWSRAKDAMAKKTPTDRLAVLIDADNVPPSSRPPC